MDDQNPYAAPQAEEAPTDFEIEGDPSVVRDGKKLVVPEGALLPTRCVSCNRPASHGHRAAIAERVNPESERDYAWAIPIALIVATGILLLAYIGVDLPLEPFALVPWWVVPALAPIVIATASFRKWRQRKTADFYICSTHRVVRDLSNLLTWGCMVAVFGWQAWVISPYSGNYEISEWLQFPYYLLWIGIAAAIVYLPVWCRVCIVGSNRSSDVGEFQGFGRRYLDSFPTADTATSTQTPSP